jgi:hypothetical protein
MFGNDHYDLTQTLGMMVNEAHQRANANQIEAREHMVRMVQNDRRLDAFDPERLVDRVRECGQSGRKLNWDDPWLKRNGQARPEARRGMVWGR